MDGPAAPEISTEPAGPARQRPALTRRQAVTTALATFKRIKDSRFGVVILKGTLAIGQASVLVTLLVLARNTTSAYGDGSFRQLDVPAAACRTGRMESWMQASIVRLLVCWLVSLWMVWRRSGVLEARQDGEATSDGVTSSGLGNDAGVDSATSSLRKEIVSCKPSSSTSLARKLSSVMDVLAPKLSLCCLLLSAALFISGNIFLFTSLDTCRSNSPYLFWGVATVIAVGWALLAEVLVVVVVVGVFGGPALAVAQKMGLAAVPRGPFPAPPKALSRAQVEKLPLVRMESAGSDKLEVVPGTGGKTAHSAPEEAGKFTASSRTAAGIRPTTVCSICLVDFERSKQMIDDNKQDEQMSAAFYLPILTAQAAVPEDRLRLLPCGHVFHPPCIDHWLTTVSGRCPVCNQTLVLS